MNDPCLHCVLKAAAEEWRKNNGRAPPQEIVSMVGNFVAQFIVSLHTEAATVEVYIMGTQFNGEHAGKLH